ncbi:MAG: alkaline phosphatase family protein, partial [Acidobacteria bacterium]
MPIFPSQLASAAEPTVIVLSWDGVRHDYLDRRDFPAIGRMQRDGVRAERMISVAP